MTKNKRRALSLILLSAFALATLASCGEERSIAASESGAGAAAEGETAAQALGVPVETRTVHLSSVSSDNTVSGMVTAEDEATVMVAVSAKVRETFVEAGDTVEEGQILCSLDMDSTLSSYRAAQLTLASAQQSYTDQAKVFDQQISSLNEALALAQRQVPIAQQQIPIAQGQIPQAEEQIAIAEMQIASAEEQVAAMDVQIAQMDDQIGQMDLSIAAAEQAAEMAEKQLSDTKALFEIGAASQLEIDNLDLQAAQARLQVEQVKTQKDQLGIQKDQLGIQKGQLEMQLESSKLQRDAAQTQVDQAKLSLSQTELSPAQAQLQVSQAQLQLTSAVATRNSTLSQLQASIESYRANVQQMESALENIDADGNVVAPAAGIVASFTAVKDGYVSSAMPVAVISGTGKMEITVAVSESLIPKLRNGDKADVTVTALGRSFTAEVRAADRTASAQTRLYTVKLSVPEKEAGGLLSGMFAEVTFHTDTIENTVAVPSEAILTDGDTQYVYIVADDGTARYTEITTGMTGDGVTVVTGGLREGERLVTVGQSYLSDGAAVRVVKEDQAG